MRISLRATLVSLLLLVVVLIGGTSAGHLSSASSAGPTTYINGDWTISKSSSLSNSVVQVNGSIYIQSGGKLTLNNVTLRFLETTNVGRGITIESGGSLIATGMTLTTTSSSLHTYLLDSSDSTLRITGGKLLDIGAAGWGGHAGLVIDGSGAKVSGVTFNDYYQAVVVSGAQNVSLSGLKVFNSTAPNNATAAVYVYNGSKNFSLTNSTFDVAQDVPSLLVISTHATVEHNWFNPNPNGTLLSDVEFAYTNDGTLNANNSLFENNTLTGTGFSDEAASNVVISDNHISKTGPNRPTGILVEAPLGSPHGFWVRNVSVIGNSVSDYSRYGIRIQQNVSNFVVAGNTVINPSTAPGPSWTEKWGGPQIDGMYLIRNVRNGVVSNNYVDMSDSSGIAGNGLILESKVSNILVSHNTFVNVSQVGVTVQGNVAGFDNAPSWEVGPSLHDYISNNVFDNQRWVTEANFTVAGVLLWQWANWTTVVNNTFEGWQKVNSATEFDGAAVYSSDSYGLFRNNTINGADYGFVFRNFTGITNPFVGEFNRSWNLVYGNILSDIETAPVVQDVNDGMGPVENVIDVLTSTSVSPGVPESYVSSIGAIALAGASEIKGRFTETLRTLDPLGGGVQTFTTTIPWTMNSTFSFTSSGGLGLGSLVQNVIKWNATSVQYNVSVGVAQQESIDLYAPTGVAWSLYAISIAFGAVKTYFHVNTTTGDAGFLVAGSGIARITGTLLGYGFPSKGGGGTNNSTVNSTPQWKLTGAVIMVDGSSPANVTVEVELAMAASGTTWVDSSTSSYGSFSIGNLSSAAAFVNISLGPSSYSILNYTLNTNNPDLWIMTVYAELSTPLNGTSPSNGTSGSGGSGGNGGHGTTPPGGSGGAPSQLSRSSWLGGSPALLEGLVAADLIALGAAVGGLVISSRKAVEARRIERLRAARRRRNR